MMSLSTALETARNTCKDAASANVLAVKLMGVRIVEGKIPSDVRKALNTAVKNGELGHLKKYGLKPEVYFHPNSLYNARKAQSKKASEGLAAIFKVCC